MHTGMHTRARECVRTRAPAQPFTCAAVYPACVVYVQVKRDQVEAKGGDWPADEEQVFKDKISDRCPLCHGWPSGRARARRRPGTRAGKQAGKRAGGRSGGRSVRWEVCAVMCVPCVCACACVCVCVHACARVFVRACVRACMHAHVRA